MLLLERVEAGAGEGKKTGLKTRVPNVPTRRESRRPGLVPSSMYQRTGLTLRRVRATCMVDVQGSLRWSS